MSPSSPAYFQLQQATGEYFRDLLADNSMLYVSGHVKFYNFKWKVTVPNLLKSSYSL